MGNNIKPKELSRLGYTDNKARSLAIELVARNCKHMSSEEITNLLGDIQLHPTTYKKDETWGRLAEVLAPTYTIISTY
jgi:tRNA-splicing ligase RtcB